MSALYVNGMTVLALLGVGTPERRQKKRCHHSKRYANIHFSIRLHLFLCNSLVCFLSLFFAGNGAFCRERIILTTVIPVIPVI